jgi:hypothetical protein
MRTLATTYRGMFLSRLAGAILCISISMTLFTCVRMGIRDVYAPTYLAYDELRVTIATSQPEELRETGKIYVKDDFLYINELHRGIHIIDNSDPASPEVIAFLAIPGNVDIAILGTILYADSYVDLVAIDISDPHNAVETGRVTNAFPNDPWRDMPVSIFWSIDRYEDPDENAGIVTGWEKVDEEIYFEDSRLMYDVVALEGSNSTGTGGSLARFTIVDSWLYALHESYMQLFSLEEPASPVMGETVDVGWDIETIFPYENMLFIGSTTGMYIFDNTNPASPVELSRFAHVTSCDPVVVQGDRAYVTLRSGSMCGGGVDQLDVIDISNPEDPQLISSFTMNGPSGLGIDGNILFICDGTSGLRIFEVLSDTAIDEIVTFDSREVFDVILVPPIAIVVGPEGIDQYNYSATDDIYRISHLDV